MEKVKEGLSKLSIADLNTVREWGWDGAVLLEELVKLDYELLPGIREKEKGSVAQWSDVLVKWPQTWRLLVNAPKSIVGYWHFVPLKKEFFDIAIQGRLFDKDITADKLMPLDKPGTYDVYWVMSGVVGKLQHTDAYDVLYNSFLGAAEELAERGIFIRNVCDTTYSDSGAASSESFGRKIVAKHISRGNVHLGKFYPFPEQMLSFVRHPKLIKLYSEHFGRGLGSLLKK
jgi:hypothetical protein